MRMKVYIIDEAHMLTKEGANAFLKTLEEPPPHAVFILATTEPEKLPVTILSRCQRYAFRRISIPVMIERMREIAAAEGIPIDEAALAAIAYRADGGLRDALTMLEQARGIRRAARRRPRRPRSCLRARRAGNYAAQCSSTPSSRGDAASALREIETPATRATDMYGLDVAHLIASFPRICSWLASIPSSSPATWRRRTHSACRTAARSCTRRQLTRALRVLSEAQSLARSGGNPRLELETALLRYVLAGEDPTLDGRLRALGGR